MIHDDRFAKYVSTRKVTKKEIEEKYAYPNATVVTTVEGLKGLKSILDTQFPGEDFVEGQCDGIVDADYEQLVNGYVSYWVQIDYVQHINEHGQTYAEREEWGGMHKYA